jgi:hypothetical protein
VLEAGQEDAGEGEEEGKGERDEKGKVNFVERSTVVTW